MRRVAVVLLGLAACSDAAPKKPPPDAPSMMDDMVLVHAGWFTAGCGRMFEDKDGGHGAALSCVSQDPPRRVYVSSFEIDRLEVTVAHYRACLAEGACAWTPRAFDRREPREPVMVPFDAAEAYCRWRGKRLPTSAEWQKTARGPDDARIFPWGDEPPDCLRGFWSRSAYDLPVPEDCGDPLEEVHRVGSYPRGRSPYGALDMFGNAAEWTTDWAPTPVEGDADLRFDRVEVDGHRILALDWRSVRFRWPDPVLVDPKGPPDPGSDRQRLARGGPAIVGYSYERWAPSADSLEDVLVAGIRCVRSVPGPPPPDVAPLPAGEFAYPYRENETERSP